MANRVFLDTIAFLAFLNRLHPKHFAVCEAFAEFARLKTPLYTSIFVITQVHQKLLTHASPSIANQFAKIITQSQIIILSPTPADQRQALQILNQPASYQINLQDALHISLIQRKNITRALSTSPYFSQHRISLV